MRLRVRSHVWVCLALVVAMLTAPALLAQESEKPVPKPTQGKAGAPAEKAPAKADGPPVEKTPGKSEAPVEKAPAKADAPGAKPKPKKPSWVERWNANRPPPQIRTDFKVESSLTDRLMSLVGMALLVLGCWAMSNNRALVSWRLVVIGLTLQLAFGVLVLKTAAGHWVFEQANTLVGQLLDYSDKGADFLFGDLIKYEFGRAFLAFKVLPTLIFFSSLLTVLYHVGFMERIVTGIAWVMQRTMGTSGSETLSAVGNIFVGQTEAPLLVKPFVKDMTQSELMAVMTGGFATVAGGVMAAYVGFLKPYFPDVAGHLLSASIMSAPAALVCAKIMVPEPDPKASATYGSLRIELEKPDANLIDAAARGAGEGLKLALNVGAMLLAFIALIALLNDLVGWGFHLVGLDAALGFGPEQRVNLQFLLGKLLAPVAFVMGVPWEDAEKVGQLLGLKTVVNEFVAYLELAWAFGKDPNYLQPRSLIITTYALCGFANFSSIAIQIGGIGGIAPERRSDLARLGLRAMVAGTIAAFMTGTVAGLLI